MYISEHTFAHASYIHTCRHNYRLHSFIHLISVCYPHLHSDIHTDVHTHIQTYIHTYTTADIRANIRTYIHTHMHAYMRHTYPLLTYVHTDIQAIILRTYINTRIHAYIRAEIHIYYICLPVFTCTYAHARTLHSYMHACIHTYIHKHIR